MILVSGKITPQLHPMEDKEEFGTTDTQPKEAIRDHKERETIHSRTQIVEERERLHEALKASALSLNQQIVRVNQGENSLLYAVNNAHKILTGHYLANHDDLRRIAVVLAYNYVLKSSYCPHDPDRQKE